MTVIRKVLVELVPAFYERNGIRWYRNDEWELEDAIEYAKEAVKDCPVNAHIHYEYYTEDGEKLAIQELGKIRGGVIGGGVFLAVK